MGDLFQKLIEKETGLAVELEHRFAPPRKWRFDYSIPKYKIAIEIDGGSFQKRQYKDKKTGEKITTIGGRHNSAKGFIGDCEKLNKATELGWVVLRYTPQQLLKQTTIDQIRNVIILRKNEVLCKF